MGASLWDHHPWWEFHPALAYRSVPACLLDHQSVLVFLRGCQSVSAYRSDHRPW